MHAGCVICLLQTFYWRWYCSGREQGSSLQSFMRAFITGWLPSLLLNLWLAMVMPRLVYLIVQVCDMLPGLSCWYRAVARVVWDISRGHDKQQPGVVGACTSCATASR